MFRIQKTDASYVMMICRAKQHQDKLDIYDLGVILLEVISGKPLSSTDEVEVVKDEVCQ